MPELPEVETLAVQLRERICGAVLTQVVVRQDTILRTSKEEIEEKLPGRQVLGILRRGKLLRFELEGDRSIWFHLGMTGQFLWSLDPSGEDPHIHLVLKFDRFPDFLIFRDIRKFGFVLCTNGDETSLPEGIRELGPEPFQLESPDFVSIFKTRKGRIKNLLLNQRIVSGLGNIYADESLHRAGIDPRRRPYRLSRLRLARLHQSIVQTLGEAIEGGGSSIDDFRHTDGARGSFQKYHRVYGREGSRCLACGTLIRRIRLAGRSSFFCPRCQK